MSQAAAVAQPSSFEQRFGHPPGLFVLFFAEMWERFSYYGMRALLVFYMTKGFLHYNDDKAYAVYGSYTSLVYMTPFFGGMLADRLLGARRSVVLGGALMAAGHLLMTVEATVPFFLALALLICGNGFFKPNISTIVGGLYPEGDGRRDGGFTLFYMGINLGAALAPLVCGYVGETFGWHYGFGLATIGMLVGLAVFVAPARVTQVMIMGTAVLTALGMVAAQLGEPMVLAVNAIDAVALVVAAGVAWLALNEGALAESAGAPPDAAALQRSVMGLPVQTVVYLGVAILIPIVAGLVSGASLADLTGAVVSHHAGEPTWREWLMTVSIAEILLDVVGVLALAYIALDALGATRIERERLLVAVILTGFSLLFWAFFEQAGTSMNLFTDRNVDRVLESRTITQAEIGAQLTIPVSQEQLGYTIDGKVFTIDRLDAVRAKAREEGKDPTITFTVDAAHVGMGVSETEIAASMFQAANPNFILIFGLLFTALWGTLARMGREPSTPVKFSLGLLQLGLGFGVLWYATETADARGMVGMSWLILGYLLHTTGELCLSPVGLSMITRLSPQRLVATMMGVWFLASAFAQLVSAKIAQLTGVGGEGGEEQLIPPPIDTVHVYGDVFYYIAIASLAAAAVLLAMSPLLTRWMHEDRSTPAPAGGH
ncbi:MAG TPA: oligopeptide:H+ symporter [Myxococcota bacterium]|nr:oligopeptide:H+ symporter [Myxococcota bacterium]